MSSVFNKPTQQMQTQSTYFKWESNVLPVLFIVALLIWSCSSSEGADHHELFKEYFSPTSNDLVKTNTGEATQRLNEQAFRLYDQQRYDQALILFDELLKGQKDPNLLFYKGNTLLILGQYQSALQIFQTMPEGHGRYLSSQWYAGLASLKLGQLTQAKIHLNLVANNEQATNRSKARQLLRSLN